jgi:hypothetical protein
LLILITLAELLPDGEAHNDYDIFAGADLPSLEDFWNGQQIKVSDQNDIEYPTENFCDDCGGHPAWSDKVEWLGGERAAKSHLLNCPTHFSKEGS